MARAPLELSRVDVDDASGRNTTGAIALVRLNRPEVENAIDDATMHALEGFLDTVEADDTVRVIILTAAGTKTFCAGGDLSYFATLRDRAQARAMSERMQSILRRLAEGPRPVIAAVNGNAWGGGCEILTACHLRLAADHVRLGFRQAAMGVVTGWGGGARLFRLLGRGDALRLLLTAEAIDASEALRIGLINAVVPAEALLATARAWASSIAAHPPHAIQAMLALARATDTLADNAADNAADDAPDARAALVDRETALFVEAWGRDHFQGKLSAWAARPRSSERPPS